MHAWGCDKPEGPLVQLNLPELDSPTEDQVLIEVMWCALCHSDLQLYHDAWNMTPCPFVPGHEVIGRIVAAGSGSSERVGHWVGVGWQCGSCGQCDLCTTDNEHLCSTGKRRTCVNQTGGMATRIRCSSKFAFDLPEVLRRPEAAPLFCAGATVYTPLARHLRPGQKLLVVGCGGLGHLAIKFARAMGASVEVCDPDSSKKDYICSIGGGRVLTPMELKETEARYDMILVTTGSNQDWDNLMQNLKVFGNLCLVGIPSENISINPEHILDGRKILTGSVIGSPAEIRSMLEFAAKNEILAEIELMKPAQLDEAFKRLKQGNLRFRAVMDVGSVP